MFVGLVLIFLRLIKSTFWPLGCAPSITRGNNVSDAFYTPPAADLTVSSKSGPPFFTVSLGKLTVMLIVTSGLYGIYWCFKNWSLYKAYSGRSLWPLPRTLFGLFYTPSLFYKIDGVLKEQGKGRMPYWAGSAAAMILLAFAPHIVGFVVGFVSGLSGRPFSGIGLVPTIAVSIIPLLLQCLILRRVQSFINRLNGDAEGSQNKEFTGWNSVWMVIGVICWGLGIALAVSMNEAFDQ